eukprot:1158194-Pelagomonas_calceolata.AAC.6
MSTESLELTPEVPTCRENTLSCFHKNFLKRRKFENSISGKKVQVAMTNVFMLCFVLQFSASTVIGALQCFKKGNRRYSL